MQWICRTVDTRIKESINPKGKVVQWVLRVPFSSNDKIKNSGTHSSSEKFLLVNVKSGKLMSNLAFGNSLENCFVKIETISQIFLIPAINCRQLLAFGREDSWIHAEIVCNYVEPRLDFGHNRVLMTSNFRHLWNLKSKSGSSTLTIEASIQTRIKANNAVHETNTRSVQAVKKQPPPCN